MAVKIRPPAKIWLLCRTFSVIILFPYHGSIWRGWFTISYDESKITLERIMEMHREEGYEIQGETVWVK